MTDRTKRLIGLGLGLALIAGVSLGFMRVRWQVADYKARLVSQGVKLTLQELTPPVVLPEENAGPRLAFLAGRLQSGSQLQSDFVPSMRLVAPGRAAVAWRQPSPLEFVSKRSALTNVTWEEVAEIMSVDRDILAEAREMLARPHLDLYLDYSQGFSLLLPHLAPLKSLAMHFARLVPVELHAGNLEAAGDNLHALLVLNQRQSEERLIISQMIRLSLAQFGLRATWEALQAAGWKEAQLERLQRDWELLRFVPAMKQALGMERAIALECFEKGRQSARFLDDIGGASSQGSSGGNSFSFMDLMELPLLRPLLWQWYYSYPDELHYLQTTEIVRSCFDDLQSGGPFLAVNARQKEAFAGHFGVEAAPGAATPKPGLGYWLTRMVVPSEAGILGKTAQAETARSLAITAIALARYRLSHGTNAPALSALTPKFLAAIPIDPMDAKALRYRARDDGTYLLYSIGEDGQDDKGDANSPSPGSSQYYLLQGKDWVWPAVATPEEIAAAAAKKR